MTPYSKTCNRSIPIMTCSCPSCNIFSRFPELIFLPKQSSNHYKRCQVYQFLVSSSFSFVVTMVASVPSGYFTLWKMTPKRNDPTAGDKIKKKFRLCFFMLGIYIFSFFACCAWAINFRRFDDSSWRQAGWAVLYQVMEFIFKILIAANVTTRLNGQRWLQLNSVVDLIFASVQTAMLPFFASWISVMISVAAAIFTISLRSYAGVDRLQKFLPKAKEVITSSSGPTAAFKGISGLAAQMTTSPVKDIAPMTSARLLGNRGLPEWAGHRRRRKRLRRHRNGRNRVIKN